MSGEQNPFTNREMQQYFSSLAPVVQESIEQCGMKFDSLDQLQSFVSHLQDSKS